MALTPQTVRDQLLNFSTCDISDALLKLEHPHGGYLPGLSMWSPKRQEGHTKIIGPAYTVKFVRKHITSAPKLAKHYIDTVPQDSVIFISAPAGTFNAVYGGLMSQRAKYSGAVGTVVDGVFRDLQEHINLEYPVFGRDVGTPAFYEVARPSEVNVPVKFQDLSLDVTINPGDYIVADLNGVVCIPQKLLAQVISMIAEQVAIDEKMAVAIAAGSTFADASAKFRGR